MVVICKVIDCWSPKSYRTQTLNFMSLLFPGALVITRCQSVSNPTAKWDPLLPWFYILHIPITASFCPTNSPIAQSHIFKDRMNLSLTLPQHSHFANLVFISALHSTVPFYINLVSKIQIGINSNAYALLSFLEPTIWVKIKIIYKV